MLTALSSAFTWFKNLGISKDMNIDEVQRVQLTNILAILPSILYVTHIVYGFIDEFYFAVIICFILIALSLLGIFLNKKGYHDFSKFLLFSINSLSIFATYNCLRVGYSVCCYFFPILMAYQILYDFKKKWKIFLLTLSITIFCFIGCFIFPKGLFYFYSSQNLILESESIHYISPFIISLLFMMAIMNMYTTTQTKLIEAKEDAEASYKAKSTFLSNMSHELRTPLNGIIGSTNLLSHEEINLSQKKYFDIIQYSSEHMLNLVNHILDFSKIEAGKLELDSNVFNVKHVISRVGNMFQNQVNNSHVFFIKEIDEELDIAVVSDDLRLSQILHNFLSNAFKFTRKGKITLKATCLSKTSNTITILFSVEDTGIGIKKDVQQKIFESFTQADSGTTRTFGGTGLGLSICKQLIEKFGSEIQLKSEYGTGSIFSFTTVLNTKTVYHKINNEEPVTNEGLLHGLTILVAEDNAVNMLLVRNFLTRWKAVIVEVSNGQDAVQKYKEEDFDLILMDLEMPIMDGFAALKEIRKLDEKIPILAFTAALYDNMLDDLKNKGFNDFIHKPFKPQTLLSKLEKYTKG